LEDYLFNEIKIRNFPKKIIGIKSAEAKDLKRSLECFNHAIEVAPHWASSYNNRAQAFRLFGEMDGILTCF
jgi:hypothetical protein